MQEQDREESLGDWESWAFIADVPGIGSMTSRHGPGGLMRVRRAKTRTRPGRPLKLQDLVCVVYYDMLGGVDAGECLIEGNGTE